MNIALIGYGQMGKEIEKIARERGHAISSIIDPHVKEAPFKTITEQTLKKCDVAIDFTHPSVVVDNIKKITQLKKNMVVGTTGWYGHLIEVEALVKKSKTSLIYASNFSLGVHLFYTLIESSAKIMNHFPSYDIGGYEFHHSKKADSPSGTAKSLGEILLKNIKRKKTMVYNTLNRKLSPEEIHFASLRVGEIPGTHAVLYDSLADTIELKHTARSRTGFALGAVMAAEFIQDKKGFFTINEMMENLLK